MLSIALSIETETLPRRLDLPTSYLLYFGWCRRRVHLANQINTLVWPSVRRASQFCKYACFEKKCWKRTFTSRRSDQCEI